MGSTHAKNRTLEIERPPDLERIRNCQPTSVNNLHLFVRLVPLYILYWEKLFRFNNHFSPYKMYGGSNLINKGRFLT